MAAPIGAGIDGEAWAVRPDVHVDAALDQARAAARMAGVTVEEHARRCAPAEALLAVAEDTGADAIVVGSRGMSGARRLLGSVPNTVSHRAPCTVVIVRTG